MSSMLRSHENVYSGEGGFEDREVVFGYAREVHVRQMMSIERCTHVCGRMSR